MKWIKNIWWLLTKAPTSITDSEKDDSVCSYCGAPDGWTQYYRDGEELFTICHRCRKIAYDMLLRKKKKKEEEK